MASQKQCYCLSRIAHDRSCVQFNVCPVLCLTPSESLRPLVVHTFMCFFCHLTCQARQPVQMFFSERWRSHRVPNHNVCDHRCTCWMMQNKRQNNHTSAVLSKGQQTSVFVKRVLIWQESSFVSICPLVNNSICQLAFLPTSYRLCWSLPLWSVGNIKNKELHICPTT